jgi:hypothetical protein
MKKVAVKKLDISAAISTLAVLLSAVVASLPLLLGDQLVVVASRVATEGTIMIQELGNSLMGLFS